MRNPFTIARPAYDHVIASYGRYQLKRLTAARNGKKVNLKIQRTTHYIRSCYFFTRFCGDIPSMGIRSFLNST